MAVSEIVSADNSKNSTALNFFLIFTFELRFQDWSNPKFLDSQQTNIRFELIRSMFNNLIKLMNFYRHIIRLYDLENFPSHFLLFLNKFHH